MSEQTIERIRISEIHIANPRPRNRARWQMIVANIREVGLRSHGEISLRFGSRGILTLSAQSGALRNRELLLDIIELTYLTSRSRY